MPDIAINDVTPRIQYTATGGQTIFPYPFAVFAATDLKVYQTLSGVAPDEAADLLVLTTEYSVSGVGAEAGGNVTLVTGAAAGDVITIERDMEIKRTTDFQLAGDFLALTLNNELDRVIMMIQQIETIFEGRAPRFGRSVDLQGFSLVLPEPVSGNLLGAGGSSLSWVALASGTFTVSAYIQTLLNDATQADAQTTLGVLPGTDVPLIGDVTASGLTQNTGKLLGRSTASSGAIEEITPSAPLTLSAGALGVDAATTSAAGKVELATTAEAQTGTDTDRAITPAAMKGAIGFSKFFESAEQAVSAGDVTVAHGLGGVPAWFDAFLRCKTGEHGYAAGDMVKITPTNTAGTEASAIYASATNVGISLNSVPQIFKRTDLTPIGVTAGNWRIVLRAWA